MENLQYKNDQLHLDGVSLESIANEFGTPCYVYSADKIKSNWLAYSDNLKSIPHKISYAVKANGNLHLLSLLDQLGARFDIVSQGEMQRVLLSGADASKITFSGVGKSKEEIAAAISAGIFCFDVESHSEINRINDIAIQKKVKAPISLRVNPDIHAATHPYISTGLKENKFGIAHEDIQPLIKKIRDFKGIELIGIAAHIGSQITSLTPFLETLKKLLSLYDTLNNQEIKLKHINIGGGLGICYQDETPPSIAEYCHAVVGIMKNHDCELVIEPGRALIANAGLLLSRVEYIKKTEHKTFAIVDAGMNDLIRPALYDAYQPILPVLKRLEKNEEYDIVGPVCETTDFLGKNREMALRENDLLVIDKVGAYGFSMSSNYNARKRPPEILIDNHTPRLIRRRETIEDLTLPEKNI